MGRWPNAGAWAAFYSFVTCARSDYMIYGVATRTQRQVALPGVTESVIGTPNPAEGASPATAANTQETETTITEWSLLAVGIRTTDTEPAHAFDSTFVKSVRTSDTALMVTRKSSTRRTPTLCTRTLPETPTHGVRMPVTDVLGTGTTINSQDLMLNRGSIASIPSTCRSGPLRNSLMSQLLEQLTLVATRLLSLQAP